jgi:hypothetical protein
MGDDIVGCKIDKCTTRVGRRWCDVHKGSSEQDNINAVVVEMAVTAGQKLRVAFQKMD